MASGSLIRNYSTNPANNELTVPFGAPVNWYPSEVSPVVRQHMTDTRVQCENAEWFNWGHTATQTSATTFTIPSDVRAIYLVGRRLRITDATVLVGTITAVSYSAPNTTVTVALDSGALSSTMNGQNVEVGILSPTSSSIPPSAIPLYWAGVTGVNSYVGTMTNPNIRSYEVGRVYQLYQAGGVPNTGSCTLNINGIGALPLQLSGRIDLSAGDFINGQSALALYQDGFFEFISPRLNNNGAVTKWGAGVTGYQKFRTGIEIQWGSGSVLAGINTQITLPSTYSNALLQVVVTPQATVSNPGESVSVNTFSAGSFFAICNNDLTFSWISIGY